MKKIGLILIIAGMVSTIGFSQREQKAKADMKFEKTMHDYGSIGYGSDGTYDFKFKNNGSKSLFITNVKSSCGCTVPVWSKQPIKPGDESVIQVKYNTKSVGPFNKTVTVFSNAENSPIRLIIKGRVRANKQTAAKINEERKEVMSLEGGKSTTKVSKNTKGTVRTEKKETSKSELMKKAINNKNKKK